jgi:anti-sigma factor ChrR (cupin superfamily)
VADSIASEGAGQRSWPHRAGLRVHLMMCRHCRAYARQIRALGVLVRRLCIEQEPDQTDLRRLETGILDRIDQRRD